jgi:signal transduction histidine kinase
MNVLSQNSTESVLRNQTILIVDDNPANLELLANYLITHDFEIMMASNGEKALQRVQYKRPDIILLDVMMPGMDGFEICRRLKADEATKDIPVIFMTALAEVKNKVRGFEVGGVDYIVKPFQYEEILVRITTHLQIQDLTRQLKKSNEDLEIRIKQRTKEFIEANKKLQREITERKQLEAEREALIAELKAKNVELEHFTYTVSHDLKSPLITIQGFLSFVEQAAISEDWEQFKADMARISKAAQKMKLLLDELLELSRIGRLMNPPEAAPLGELAHEAVAMVTGQLTERGVEVEIASDLPVVYGDRPRLQEALENLIGNAAKYMGDQPNPRIEIGMRSNDQESVFYVCDNGIGIAPCYHDKIFHLFEKLDQKVEGTGIGLAIVERIIKLHGGRIWVESEGVGRGSTFCFTLPDSRNSV